ncbi:MAG: sugar transferase [Cyanobacteria bacterium J06560_5]
MKHTALDPKVNGTRQAKPLFDTPSEDDLRASTLSGFRKGAVYRMFRIVLLLFLDTSLLALVWLTANHLGTPMVSPWRLESSTHSFIPIIGVVISILAAKGLYGNGDHRRDYIGIIKAVALGNAVLLLVAFFYAPNQFISRSHFLYFFFLGIVAICLSHYLVDLGVNVLRRRGVMSYPVFLIADPEEVDRAVSLIKKEGRYNIQGIESARALDRTERLTTFSKLESLGITEAFVSWSSIKRRLFLTWHFQKHGITLRVMPLKNESFFRGANLWCIGGLPGLSFSPSTVSGISFKAKRLIDFLAALSILLIASPLYIGIMLIIRFDSRGPIFYRQARVGLHGREFKVWKFRSMVNNADQLQKKLEAQNKNKDGILFKIDNDPRITRVGRILRQYSLDELPQIFNVLLGQMSLVGPRPLPTRDVERFSTHHFIRQEVVPGITGLWQVSGRSDIIDFEQVLRLDLDYIENWSLWMDVVILIRTVKVIFGKSGAY